MTFEELMEKVLAILPDAIVDEQAGEVVIGTGLYLDEHDQLHPIPQED